jgi:hypothetical protein
MMGRFLQTMLTAADNESADVGRVMLLFLVIALVGLAVVDVAWRGHAFDYLNFGAASGALLGGGGAGIGLKGKTEPPLPPPDPLPGGMR